MTHSAPNIFLLAATLLSSGAAPMQTLERPTGGVPILVSVSTTVPRSKGHGDIRFHDVAPELKMVVEDAVDLFSDAQLWLPELDIYAHVAKAECHNASGVFNIDGSKHRIDLCADRKCVVIHELAHAWEHHNISDRTREQFAALVGASEWNSHSQPWNRRAIELAAETIAWGTPRDPLPNRLHDREIQHLQHRYSLLTGQISERLGSANPKSNHLSPVGSDRPGSAPEIWSACDPAWSQRTNTAPASDAT